MFDRRITEWLDRGAALVEAASGDAVDAVVAWEQIISAAHARQLAATATVAEEAPAWITTERGRAELTDVQVAGAELAPALSVARVTAQRRVHFATQVTDRLPDSVAALAAGSITMPKLMAIEEATAVLSADLAHKVETMILPTAPDQTPGELRVTLAKAVIRVDPAAAEKRRKTAVGERKVTTVPLPDGMAGLWGVMPAERTVAAYTVIDTLARLAKTPDDDRGADARRADALYDLIADAHDRLVGNTSDPLSAADTSQCGNAALDTVQGAAGPADPSGAVADTEPVHEPATGVGRPARRSTRLYSVQVAVPAETLTGEAEEPGELAGYGAITPQAARELVGDDAMLQRLLFDPVTGAVLDVGRTRYGPTRPIVQHIVARDRTCRHPGCRQPAARCDLDHTRRYPDGPTSTTNLVAVCRFHHRLKHHTSWKSVMDSGGATTWTSPTRRSYITHPWDYRTTRQADSRSGGRFHNGH